jgi:hypothetical protein
MRSLVLAAFAACSLSVAAGAAQAATGSGAIGFNFTGFSGPFGSATADTLSDTSQWLLLGSVNGQIPTPNGVTSPDGDSFLYVGGTAPLSGQSVDMVYTNLPGAIESTVSFTPVAGGFNDVTTGQPFLLGTLTFTNGQWVGGSGNPATNFPVTLDFTLSTTSAATPAFNQTLHDSFTVVTNQAQNDIDCATNPQTQQDEADFVYITSAPQLGAMRVYDQTCAPAGVSNSGSVQLWGEFGSLDYVGFRNPTDGAFLTNSVNVGSLGVPEPAQWMLLLTGFGAVGWAARRRRSALGAAAVPT